MAKRLDQEKQQCFQHTLRIPSLWICIFWARRALFISKTAMIKSAWNMQG